MLRRSSTPGPLRGLILLVIAVLVLSACGGGEPTGESGSEGGAEGGAEGGGEAITLSIASNAARGGKNTEEAVWIEDYVIPAFEQQMADEGRDVTVEFEGRGADDEAYKSQLALDLRSGGGDDILTIDGIWLGEFVQAGYLSPLTDIAGDATEEWEGWEQIPDAVQGNMEFEDVRYGIPTGTDGRVIYFNKELFAQAGLPEDWQPTSWDEVLEAARTIKEQLPDVIPLQLNGGTAMGEATTMQGVLPLLAGTGAVVYDEDAQQWLGASPELQQVLDLYATVYGSEQLGDPDLQLRQDGRDRSFQEFAAGGIAMLIESDYLWRDVINAEGIAPMEQRDEVVGWAMIPAVSPGVGISGQDFVSMSGGAGRVLNPNTEHPEEAWALLTFMNSQEATLELVKDQARITQREDVNTEVLGNDPLLQFIADEVLPITAYRPPLAEYTQVSVALQEATEQVVNGTSAQEAAGRYQSELESIVGADSVAGSGG
jgi:multiple sugar transport system substrate-binding protein